MAIEADWGEPRNEQTSSKLALLKAGEVARVLGLSRSKAYALMAAEVVPTVRFGRSVRVPAAALEAWINTNTRQSRVGSDAID